MHEPKKPCDCLGGCLLVKPMGYTDAQFQALGGGKLPNGTFCRIQKQHAAQGHPTNLRGCRLDTDKDGNCPIHPAGCPTERPIDLPGIGIHVDASLPEGTVEVWQGEKRMGRIENIGHPDPSRRESLPVPDATFNGLRDAIIGTPSTTRRTAMGEAKPEIRDLGPHKYVAIQCAKHHAFYSPFFEDIGDRCPRCIFDESTAIQVKLDEAMAENQGLWSANTDMTAAIGHLSAEFGHPALEGDEPLPMLIVRFVLQRLAESEAREKAMRGIPTDGDRKVICTYCEKEFPYENTDEDRARVWFEANAHDQACPKNPLVDFLAKANDRLEHQAQLLEAAQKTVGDLRTVVQEWEEMGRRVTGLNPCAPGDVEGKARGWAGELKEIREMNSIGAGLIEGLRASFQGHQSLTRNGVICEATEQIKVLRSKINDLEHEARDARGPLSDWSRAHQLLNEAQVLAVPKGEIGRHLLDRIEFLIKKWKDGTEALNAARLYIEGQAMPTREKALSMILRAIDTRRERP